MDLNDIRLKNVLYKLEKCTLQAGSTTFDVPPSMVTGISIDNNYETSMYPFFYIGINLPGWVYIEVGKNPTNLFITLDLRAVYFTNTVNEGEAGSTIEYRGRYMAHSAVNATINDETIQLAGAKENGTYKRGYEFNEIYFAEFALYNPAYYAAMTKRENAVLTSANMTSILTYALQNGGITNVLMSPLDNKTTYSEFKITPLNAIDEIKYLMYNYGFHNNGTVFFMDLDKAFVISKAVKCTAWYQGEYKSVHIMSLSNFNQSLGGFSGYFQNTKDKYHLLAVEPDCIEPIDISNIPTTQSESKLGGEGKQLIVKTSAALMECFTPNKEFIVDIDSISAKTAKINGRYRILRVTLALTPAGEYFDPEFHVFLYK